MPSIGLGRNLVHNYHFGMEYDEQRCECCPYGYHIDLDFVHFTKKMLSREGDVERLQELKDKWRSERQSMDKLLGVADIAPKIWDVNATISRASTDIWKSSKKVWDLDTSVGNGNLHASSSSTELIFENGLSEAVTDFEEALLRTRPQARILSYEIPDTQKFHTFPRIKALALRDPVTGSNTLTASTLFSSKGSSSNTSTTLSTVIMRDSSAKTSSREFNKKSDDSLLGEMESIYSRTTRQRQEDQSRDVGERLMELEEQVRRIPELEVKLTLLKEEKRQLMKLLEVEKLKNVCSTEQIAKVSKQIENGQSNGVATNRAPVVPPRRKTRDASVGTKAVLTRDVGIMHVMPRTRSIGIGGAIDLSSWDRNVRGDSSSPTGSNAGTLKRRVKTFDVGVQASDFDLTDSKAVHSPLLQIVERVEAGSQTVSNVRGNSVERSPVRTKQEGTMVKPSTKDVGSSFKPVSRDMGINAVQLEQVKEAKPRAKDVGVTASMDVGLLLPDTPKQKSTRAMAVNTDRVRTTSVASNTTMLSASSTDPSVTSLFIPPGSSLRKLLNPTRSQLESVSTEELAGPSKASLSLFSSGIGPSPRNGSVPPAEVKVQSKIPRLAPPPVSSPVPSPKPARRNAPYSADRVAETLDSQSMSSLQSCPAAGAISSLSLPSLLKKPSFHRSDTYTKDMYAPDRPLVGTLEPLEEEDREGPRSSSASSSSGVLPIAEIREKVVPSKEMQAALKVLNDALLRGKTTQQVTNAISIILHEWFRIAGTKTANPLEVEDYLDNFEIYSPQLLRYIVNMPDGNGNTALHYAVSHGNFDVVSILLDSKVCDPNKANKAGYTSIMLVALAHITGESHKQVVRRLFSLGDVNIKAAQHGQTALMLGASHGRFDTVRLLLEAGADLNIQDEDGSTALMCAAEHGHLKIAKYFLAHSDCDLQITDNDGSTAFSIAMEASHKDIGVLLYAQMHFGRPSVPPPGGFMYPVRSRSTTPSSHSSTSPTSSAHTSPLMAKRQSSDSRVFRPNH